MADKYVTIQFATAVSSQGLVRLDGRPDLVPHSLSEGILPPGLTPEQIATLKDIEDTGFDIIVYPDGSVQLDR